MYKASVTEGDLSMQEKPKKPKQGRGGVLRPAVAGIVLCAALLAAYAAVIGRNTQAAERMKMIVIAINAVSAFVCGALSSAARGNNKLVNGLASGAIMTAVVIIVTFIIDSSYVDVPGMGVFALITLCASGVGAKAHLYNSNKKLRRRSGRQRGLYR